MRIVNVSLGRSIEGNVRVIPNIGEVMDKAIESEEGERFIRPKETHLYMLACLVEKLVKERDDARRKVCLHAGNGDTWMAEQLAIKKGWSCFFDLSKWGSEVGEEGSNQDDKECSRSLNAGYHSTSWQNGEGPCCWCGSEIASESLRAKDTD